jgi:hypothetical protein
MVAVKLRPFTIAGVLMILLGAVALAHPDFRMAAKESEVELGTRKMTIETTRIVTIPPALSGFAILAGAGLIYLSTRKP